MLRNLRPRVSFANVTSLLALFVALGGTSAYAINEWTGANIVDDSLTGVDVKGKQGTSSTPAVNGTILTQDVGGQPANPANGTPFVDGALTQWDVRDNSLKGTDIDEPTLDQVPSAVIGGLGRFDGGFGCDPDTAAFASCGSVSLNLPRAARVHVNAVVGAEREADFGVGTCRITAGGSAVTNANAQVAVGDAANPTAGSTGKFVPLTAVTEIFPPGNVVLRIECNEQSGAIIYAQNGISAVAISPN